MQEAAASNQATARPSFFYGWVVVAVVFITTATAYLFRYSFSVFYVAILDDYGWSRALTAGAYSVNMASYAIACPIAGYTFDRIGPRKLFPLGAVFLAVAALALSRSDSVGTLYLFFGIMSFAIATLGFIPSSSLIPNWFEKNRGLAMGIALSGPSFSSASLPLVQLLIGKFGWHTTYVILGVGAMLIIAPISAFFVRWRPQDMGLLPDGAPKAAAPARGAAPRSPGHALIIDRVWAAQRWTLRNAAKTPQFWWLVTVNFFNSFSGSLVSVHQVAYMVDAGASKAFAAIIAGMAGLLAASAVLTGRVSDIIGREKTFAVGVAFIVVAMLFLYMGGGAGQGRLLYLYALLYGIGLGLNLPIIVTSTADIFQGKSVGLIIGISNGITYGIGGALGPWLGGYVFDISKRYDLAFLAAVISWGLAVAALWMAAPRRIRTVPGRLRPG